MQALTSANETLEMEKGDFVKAKKRLHPPPCSSDSGSRGEINKRRQWEYETGVCVSLSGKVAVQFFKHPCVLQYKHV